MAQDVLAPSKLKDIVQASADVLSSPLEAVAAFSHACMIATGFRFLGFGEDHRAGPSPPTISSKYVSNPRLVDLEFDETNAQKLWTEDSPSHREFCYAHPQSSLQFVIKVSRLGTKTVIMGIAIGDDKTTSFDFKTDDFTSAAFFPWTAENRNVTGGFIGENRMKDLAGLFKINVLQKLIPGLSKAGYIEEANTDSENPPAQGLVPPPYLTCVNIETISELPTPTTIQNSK
jgi:proteasome inhibitor subunit 1 (PI31)